MNKIGYKLGDIILTNCQPLFKISNKCAIPVCEDCFASVEENPDICLQPCSECSLVNYCSESCRLKDWENGHMIECGSKTFANNFAKNHDVASINVRCQVFRSMAFLAMNPKEAEKQFELYNGRMRRFNDLMSHEEFFIHAHEDTEPLKKICNELADEIQAENLPHVMVNSNYLLRLGGIFQTNAFTIYNESETNELGSGIYVEASIFDHCCKPTALFRSIGVGIEIRAIATIPVGEEPYLSYISAHAGKAERQDFLSKRYNFDCCCVRCTATDEDETETINVDELNELLNYSLIPQNDLLLQLHTIIIHMMRKIYHEYDARITNQFCRTLQFALVNNNLKLHLLLKQQELRDLIQDTREHLKISCGTDHPEFWKIERAIQLNYPNL